MPRPIIATAIKKKKIVVLAFVLLIQLFNQYWIYVYFSFEAQGCT